MKPLTVCSSPRTTCVIPIRWSSTTTARSHTSPHSFARSTFGRMPAADERDRAVRVVAEFGPAVLARAIFNSNEFLYVD